MQETTIEKKREERRNERNSSAPENTSKDYVVPRNQDIIQNNVIS